MNSTNETFNMKLSLFIPRLDTRSLPVCKEDETDQDYETRMKTFIAELFHTNNIGSVDRVDLITKLTPEGYPFYIAFIHFVEWYNHFQAKGLQKAVFNPNQKAKMYVSPRNYWILCENKKPLTESEVEMKAIIYKQEKELETLKKELEAMKKYEQDSPEAKRYASYMQEQCESAARQLFETPMQSPVELERPPPLERSENGDASWSPLTRSMTEEAEDTPPLTRSMTEEGWGQSCNGTWIPLPEPPFRPITSWSEMAEEEDIPPPDCAQTRSYYGEAGELGAHRAPPKRLTRCITEMAEEEDMPPQPQRLKRSITEMVEEEDMPPQPQPLTRSYNR